MNAFTQQPEPGCRVMADLARYEREQDEQDRMTMDAWKEDCAQELDTAWATDRAKLKRLLDGTELTGDILDKMVEAVSMVYGRNPRTMDPAHLALAELISPLDDLLLDGFIEGA